MPLVGLTWFIGNVSISDVPVLHELGTLFSGIAAAAVVALILAYPGGRLETRLDRATVTLLAFGFLATNALLLLPVSDEIDMTVGLLVVNLALAAFAGLVVIRRWVVAPRRSRPELLPVLIAGSIQMAVLVTFVAVQIVAVPESLEAFLIAAKTLAPAAIPLALLVGFYRQSELRQRALLDAMPDAMIRLTTDGQYLDIRANEFELLRGLSIR